jgi:hypothetical protein
MRKTTPVRVAKFTRRQGARNHKSAGRVTLNFMVVMVLVVMVVVVMISIGFILTHHVPK